MDSFVSFPKVLRISTVEEAKQIDPPSFVYLSRTLETWYIFLCPYSSNYKTKLLFKKKLIWLNTLLSRYLMSNAAPFFSVLSICLS